MLGVFLRPKTRWWEWSPLACAGFLQRLWEKPTWEGVWPYPDPCDSACLRTASVEWNVPGKYGPHGELFFFLMQKEPATMPGSETFSPFFAADIRTPFFSLLMSSRSAHRHAVTWKGIVSRWQKAWARVARATVPAVLMEPRQAVRTTLRLVIWSVHVWKPM